MKKRNIPKHKKIDTTILNTTKTLIKLTNYILNNDNLTSFNQKEAYTFFTNFFYSDPIIISHDNQYMFSRYRNTITLWDFDRQYKLKNYHFSNEIDIIAVIPNSDNLIVVCEDNVIRILNIITGKITGTCIGHTAHISTIKITPDNRYILSSSYDGTIRLWSRNNFKEIKRFNGNYGTNYITAFTSDGKVLIATANNINHRKNHLEKYPIKIWDPYNETLPIQINEENSNSCHFKAIDIETTSRNEAINEDIFLISNDCVVLLYGDGPTLSCEPYYETTSYITKGMFTPDKQSIVLLEELPYDGEPDFSTKDSLNMPCYVITILDIQKKRKTIHEMLGRTYPDILGLISNEKILLGDINNNSLLLNFSKTQKNHSMNLFGLRPSSISALCTTLDGAHVVAGYENGMILIIHITSGKIIQELKGHHDQIVSLMISSDGKDIISGSLDGYIKVWDTFTGSLKKEADHFNTIDAVVISSDNKYIYVKWQGPTSDWPGVESLIYVINISAEGDDTKTDIHRPLGNKYSEEIARYLNNYNYTDTLLIVNDEYLLEVFYNSIYLIKTENSEIVKEYKIHAGEIFATSLSNDKKSLFIAYRDKFNPVHPLNKSKDKNYNIIQLDIESGKTINHFSTTKRVICIAITSHNILLIGHSNGATQLNVQSGNEICNYATNYPITTITLTQDECSFFSGGIDGIIKLWDIKSGELLISYAGFVNNKWISWNNNNEFNCSKDTDKYFNFIDNTKYPPKIIDRSNPIYQKRKKENLLHTVRNG